MRTAAKVFVVIAMIINIIIAFVSFATSVPVGLILIGLALSVGITALSRLSNELVKPSIAVSICTLLLLSPIAGILMLCIPEGAKRRTDLYDDQCEICLKRDPSVNAYSFYSDEEGPVVKQMCTECKNAYFANKKAK